MKSTPCVRKNTHHLWESFSKSVLPTNGITAILAFYTFIIYADGPLINKIKCFCCDPTNSNGWKNKQQTSLTVKSNPLVTF